MASIPDLLIPILEGLAILLPALGCLGGSWPLEMTHDPGLDNHSIWSFCL